VFIDWEESNNVSPDDKSSLTNQDGLSKWSSFSFCYSFTVSKYNVFGKKEIIIERRIDPDDVTVQTFAKGLFVGAAISLPITMKASVQINEDDDEETFDKKNKDPLILRFIKDLITYKNIYIQLLQRYIMYLFTS